MRTKSEKVNYDYNKSTMSCLNDAENQSEDYLQFCNDLEMPMLFNNENTLLQDTSPEEFILEATKDSYCAISPPHFIQTPNDLQFGDEFNDFNPMDLDTDMFPDMISNSTLSVEDEILDYIKVESNSSDNENFKTSDSPTPSQSSNDSLNMVETGQNKSNKYVFDTPPISPTQPYQSPSSPMTVTENVTPVIINGNTYNLITVDTMNQNHLQNIVPVFSNKLKSEIKIEPKATNEVKKNVKIPILKNRSLSNRSQKMSTSRNSLPQICSFNNIYPDSILNSEGVQIITLPGDNITFNTSTMTDSELKALKRQQRMIKNRASACMSRKRKKDYVTSLENELKQISDENRKLKKENELLRNKLSELTKGQLNMKIPSYATKSTVVLLGVLLVVSFGPLGNLITHRESSEFEQSGVVSVKQNNRISRNLLWLDGDWPSANYTSSIPPVSKNKTVPLSLCPANVNQTESIRLASELRRWIGEPSFNWTEPPTETIKKRRKIRIRNTIKSLNHYSKHNQLYKFKKDKRNDNSYYKNEVQIYSFNPKYYEYADFFASINKRDDTFYVVSFSSDQLLLPALNHNKTLRPKMSLILPALTFNDTNSNTNDHITLMQIDCEVTNTNVLHVNENAIPQHLRMSINSTNYDSSNKNNNSFDKNEINIKNSKNISIIKNTDNKYKPYFLKDFENNKWNMDVSRHKIP